jgi:hypothetical protein
MIVMRHMNVAIVAGRVDQAEHGTVVAFKYR